MRFSYTRIAVEIETICSISATVMQEATCEYLDRRRHKMVPRRKHSIRREAGTSLNGRWGKRKFERLLSGGVTSEQ